MKSVLDGIIVMSNVDSIGTTDMRDGLITIETPDCDLIKLKVGSYTVFETLDEGKRVLIEAKALSTTNVLFATNIIEIE